MNHSFNVELAVEVGIEAAIIFENIQHWVAKNQANGENIKNGYAWTYNSRAAWCELLPYMGEKQIRNALEKLLEAHLIERDTFSFGPMNRTYWYRLGERAKQFGRNGQTEVGRKGQTKTLVNTDINLTIPPNPLAGEFDGFWKEYPNKVGKPQALKTYLKQKPDLTALLEGLRCWKSSPSWTKDGGRFIPHPSTFLNRRQWEDRPMAPPSSSVADRYKNVEPAF